MSAKSVTVLVTVSVIVMVISQSLAESPVHCTQDRDCGEGPEFNNACNTATGSCVCPLGSKKYVLINSAKPQCQKIASIGQSCQYDEQCNLGPGGALSKCRNQMCDCHDTISGREVVKPWKGVCYRATALGQHCENELQCQAFIEPEEHVQCSRNASTSQYVCQCDQGQKCEHKSGSATQTASLTTFVSLGLVMATKLVL